MDRLDYPAATTAGTVGGRMSNNSPGVDSGRVTGSPGLDGGAARYNGSPAGCMDASAARYNGGGGGLGFVTACGGGGGRDLATGSVIGIGGGGGGGVQYRHPVSGDLYAAVSKPSSFSSPSHRPNPPPPAAENGGQGQHQVQQPHINEVSGLANEGSSMHHSASRAAANESPLSSSERETSNSTQSNSTQGSSCSATANLYVSVGHSSDVGTHV